MTGKNYQSQLQLAINWYQMGQLQSADHLYRKLLRQIPENQELLYYFGKLNLHLSYYKSAVYWILKALQKGPGKAIYYNSLAIAYQRLQQTTLAERYFKEALQIEPQFSRPYYNLSQLFALQHKWSMSLNFIQQALELEPQSILYFRHLKQIRLKSQRDLQVKPSSSSQLEQILNCEVIAIFSCNTSGSNFIQSLLDSHPQTLMFPGFFIMNFHHPEHSQLTRALTHASFEQLEQLIDDFCQRYTMCFEGNENSTNFNLMRLGKECQQTLKVSQSLFKKHFLSLSKLLQARGHFLSRKLFFIMMHYAYAQAQGQSIERKNTIIYHLHIPDLDREIYETWIDFPYFKAILTYRQPLNSIYSSLRRTLVRLNDGLSKSYTVEDIVLSGYYCEYYRKQYMGYQSLLSDYRILTYSIQIEKLHAFPDKNMRRLAKWLNLEWNPCLLESTWNGLTYWGSKMVGQTMTGFAPEYHRQDRTWKHYGEFLEAYILGGLIPEQMAPYAKVSHLQVFLAKYLNILPTQLERQVLFKTLYKGSFAKFSKGLKQMYRRQQLGWHIGRRRGKGKY